jgi:autotransporter-associated beta strand protein
LTTNNNSYNAAVYLGDANNAGGGLSTAANLTNNVSDGDVTFTNSGVFTIGGQNTGGINTYANPIILGWTANRGKSVTLVAAGGGEVDFTGGIRANGTDTTAGITVGDAAHGGTVKLRGTANTYAGPTTVSNGTLIVSGTIGNGAVNVANGTLLVSGTVGNGAVTIGNGATLAGGGVIGGAVASQSGGSVVPGKGASAAGTVLTINNGLTLSTGSTTTLAVSHNSQTNDRIACVAIVYGGTLNVTTIAGDAPLASGDTFQLFKANSSAFYSGSFSATNLPALSPGLVWSNSLGAGGNGTITVTGTVVSQQPVTISGGAISGGMFVISGTNGVPGAAIPDIGDDERGAGDNQLDAGVDERVWRGRELQLHQHARGESGGLLPAGLAVGAGPFQLLARGCPRASPLSYGSDLQTQRDPIHGASHSCGLGEWAVETVCSCASDFFGLRHLRVILEAPHGSAERKPKSHF